MDEPLDSTPGPVVGAAIDEAFGSFDDFKAKFKQAGMTQFGSGWAWLVLDGGKLKGVQTANADTPMTSTITTIIPPG